jgi:hypothetical protein
LRLQTVEELPLAVVGAQGGWADARGSRGREAVVYLAQDAELAFLWRGRYWPEKSGWQLVYRPTGDSAWWYVWPAGAWKGMDRGARSEVKRRVVAGERESGGGSVVRERVEFPKGWFLGLFLLGMVVLWVEGKIGGMNG